MISSTGVSLRESRRYYLFLNWASKRMKLDAHKGHCLTCRARGMCNLFLTLSGEERDLAGACIRSIKYIEKKRGGIKATTEEEYSSVDEEVPWEVVLAGREEL